MKTAAVQEMNSYPTAPPEPDLASDFRGAMRRSAASASLITTSLPSGDVAGMAATSVCSLSLSPPALLVCVNQVTHTHSVLHASQRFCVNFVRVEDRLVCESFGRASVHQERFSTGCWIRDVDDLPLLQTALANILCVVDGQFAYGTHTVFIGRVHKVILREQSAPLLYHDGSYGRFSAFIDDGADARVEADRRRS